MQPTNLQINEGEGSSEKIIFPGAVVTYINYEFPVQLLQDRFGASPDVMLNNSIQGLEYGFANAIRQLTLKRKPRIGIIEGHGEPDTTMIKDFTKSISEYYAPDRVKISGKIINDTLVNDLLHYDALVIAKPQLPFPENEKFLIDQFIMKGGRVLWLIDGMNATMDSLAASGTAMATDLPLNLEDMFFHYGVRVNPSLIMDLKSSAIPMVTGIVGTRPRTELRPWFYYPLMFPESNHPIVNNLNAVLFKFVSTLDTVRVSGVQKTFLLKSSEYSKVLFTPARISLATAKEKPNMSQFNKRNLPVAVLLEGEFKSVFKNRVPLDLTHFAIDFKEKSKPTKMIVVSDGDIILNDYKRSTGQVYPLGFDSFTGQQFGNKNFLLNCVDYLCDDSGLMAVRSKDLKLRMLDKTKVTDEKLFWQIANTGGTVLLVLIFAFIQTILRKRKFRN